jgi:hypothetical protein
MLATAHQAGPTRPPKQAWPPIDIQISDFLDRRLNEDARVNERRIGDLKGRIEKLEAFSAMASALRSDLQKQIEELSSDHLKPDT